MFKVTLEAARVNAHMTQDDVAKSLDVSRQTVSRWECGEVIPSIKNVMRLCSLYECPIDNLSFILPTDNKNHNAK